MLDYLTDLFKKYLYHPIGLIFGIILIIPTIIVPIDNFIQKGVNNFLIRCFIYLALIIIWILIWYVTKKHLPTNSQEKIGIFVALTTESDKQKIRIKNDFINELRGVVLRNDLSALINIIHAEDYKAAIIIKIIDEYNKKKIESFKNNQIYLNESKENENLKKLLNKTKCHYFIYGSIKERLDQGNKYFFNFNAIVTHKPIDFNLSNRIAQEFSKIFPKEISFFEKTEFQGFKFSSQYLFLAARYMIGVASLISRDPFTAFKIHSGLDIELNKLKPLPENIIYISEKLKKLLSEELLLQSKYYYDIKEDTETTLKLLAEAEKFDNENYGLFIFKSYYEFVINKKPEEAIKYCNIAKEYSNHSGTWLYNKAFLYMFIEKFEEGLKCYKKIRNENFEDDDQTAKECIDFNEDFFNKNPDFYQSLFILGYLYYYKVKNLPLALERFELFIKSVSDKGKYRLLLGDANRIIESIKKQMAIN